MQNQSEKMYLFNIITGSMNKSAVIEDLHGSTLRFIAESSEEAANA